MAVVPKLQRLNPVQSLPSNDRIQFKAQDKASGILQQTDAISNIGEKYGDIFQKEENAKIETLSNQAEQEYTVWNNQKLAELKKIEGDPTKHYQAYEEEAVKKREEILGRNPDISDRVRRHLNTAVNKTYSSQSIIANKQRGAQHETYENNVFESQIKLKKDSVPVNAGYIRKGEPSSYSMVDQSINDMMDTIAKRGVKTGTVEELKDDATDYTHTYKEPDEIVNGVKVEGRIVKYKFSDLAKQRFAKERSESLKNGIQVLIDNGNLEEAREMKERYKGQIDALNESKLEKKFNKADRKQEAYKIIGESNGTVPEAKIQEIRRNDPELAQEVIKHVSAYDKQITEMRSRRDKRNYDALMGELLDRRKNGNSVLSIADFESDPKLAGLFDNIQDAKKQKAILEFIEAPTKTDPKAEMKLQEKWFSGEIANMEPSDFQEHLGGMDESDRKKWNNRYFSLKNETPSESRAVFSMADKMLTGALLKGEYIRRDKYSGQFKGESENKLYDARRGMIEYLDSLGPNPKREEVQKFIDDYSVSVIKQTAFNSDKYVKKPASVTRDQADITITSQQLKDFQLKFYKDKSGGYMPETDDPKFEAWLRKQPL